MDRTSALIVLLSLVCAFVVAGLIVGVSTPPMGSSASTVAEDGTPAPPVVDFGRHGPPVLGEEPFVRKPPLPVWVGSYVPEPLSPSPGDWVVNETEVHEDEVIILTGNLIVGSEGNLTLVNCTLMLNCTWNHVWSIRVDSGGVMNVLDGSNITAYTSVPFDFWVYGSLTMRDSFLSHCGLSVDRPGLVIATDEGVLLEDSTITHCYYGVLCGSASHVKIRDCSINNAVIGIVQAFSEDIFVSNCVINNNDDGIYCYKSHDIVISRCSIEGNDENGIIIDWSSDVAITKCYFSENGCAVSPYGSDGITISGCKIFYNEIGVYADEVFHLTLEDSVFFGNGLTLTGWELKAFATHTIENNTVNGKPLYYVVNATNYVVPSDAGQVIIANSSGITVRGVNASNTDVGIEVVCFSEDVKIEDSTFVGNNLYGVYCHYSSDITVSNCNMSNNGRRGITAGGVSNVLVSDSTIDNNSGDGAFFTEVNGVTLIRCHIGDNWNDGISCEESSSIGILNCTVENSHLDHGVYIYLCSKVVISGCIVSNNTDNGISCSWSGDIAISYCVVRYNGMHGIYLPYVEPKVSVSHCVVSYNSFWGVYYSGSSDADIHCCDIYSNGWHGLYVDTNHVVNATGCWWGSPDGPEYKEEGDPEDPEEVYSSFGSEYLIYEPWLTEPCIDIEPPSLTVTYPPEGAVLSGTVTISANASDPSGVAEVSFYVDGTLVFTDTEAPYEYVWDTTTAADGEHTITVAASDTRGNVAEQSVAVVVDNTAPTVSITSPEEGAIVRGAVTIQVDASDATSGILSVEFYVDGDLVFTDTSPPYKYRWDTTEVTDGSHTIRVVASDEAGNTAEQTISVAVDNTAPTVSISKPSPGALIRGTVTISVEASDEVGVASVAFYIDDELLLTDTEAPYAYDWDTTAVADGKHTIRIVVSDLAGNTAEVSITVTVDNTAPTVSITSPSSGEAVRGVVTISVDASDATSVIVSVKFYVDGELLFTDTEAPYEYDWDTTAVSDGSHTIRVVVFDAAGNEAETSVSVVVDNTAPTVGEPSISPEAPAEGEDVEVSVEASDATSGVAEVILSYSTDGGATWTNVTMTAAGGVYKATIPGQEAGVEVTYKIYVYDEAGNCAVSPEYSYAVKGKPAPKPGMLFIYLIIGAAAATVIIAVIIFIMRKPV